MVQAHQNSTTFETITENEGLPSNYVFKIVQDENNIFWAGTDKGLTKYENGKWHTYTTDDNLPGNYVNHLLSDKNGGLLLYFSENGLFYFDIKTNKITQQLKQISPKSDYIQNFSDLDKNYIIISDSFMGNNGQISQYFIFDIKNKKFLAAHQDAGFIIHRGKKYSTTKVLDHRKTIIYKNKVYEIDSSKGVLVKDGSHTHLINEENGLQSNFVTDFLITHNNSLFITTLGGGISIQENTINRKIFKIEQIKTRDILYSKPYYYLLSEGFIYQMDKEKIISKRLTIPGALTMFRENNDFYVGTFNGIYKYEDQSSHLQMKHSEPGTMGVSRIFKANNQIYFSTYGSGIVKLSKGLYERKTQYPYLNFENIFVTKDGFAGVSYQSGLMLLDKDLNLKKYYNKKNGLPTNFVTYAFDSKDTLWIGMKNNLAFLNKGKLRTFSDSQHLRENGIVKLIFKDKKLQTWVVTETEIYKISKNMLIHVGTFNVLNANNKKIIRAAYNPQGNELLISTTNEFSIVNLNNLIPHAEINKPKIEKIFLNDENFNWDNGKIKLDNNYKNLKIVFKSIDNDILSKNNYQYSLNNRRWTDFPNANILTISNLNTGTYHIRIRSINASGNYKLLKENLNLKIKAPYYFRWWFIVSALLFFIAITALVIDSYTNKKYDKKLEAIRIQNEIENERKRISRDLHDNIGAYTTSLISKVDHLRSKDQNHEAQLLDIRENADRIMSLIRQTIWILTSRETSVENYVDTFKSYAVKYFASYSDIKVIFNEDIKKERILESDIAMSLFRIVQEALQNIMKHSEATEVKITFISDDKMFLKIEDNGKGFDVNNIRSGFGIKNMRERCKEMNIKCQLKSGEKGTVMEFTEL